MPQRGLEGRLAISRRYTSGAKSTWEADFHPDVTRQENWKVPQRGLEGRLTISRRYTSGAKSTWEADFHPDVTRPELKVRGRPIFFPTLHVRKTGSGETGKGSGERPAGSATEGPE